MQKLLYSLIFVQLFFSFYAQKYQFKILSPENSTIYPYIYALNQDTTGYLWIGTGDGLFLYDGNNLINYPLTLIGGDNFVTAILTDKTGECYIGLNNGAILYKKESKFELIKESLFLFKSTITQISKINNEVWVAVQNKGIFKIKDYKIQPNPLYVPNMQTYSFLVYNNIIFIGTSDGLFYSYNDNLIPFQEISETKVECIHYNPITNSIFVGTEDMGMFEIQINKNKPKVVKHYAFLNNIKDIIHDKEGNLWIATMNDGVYFYRYFKNNGSFVQELLFSNETGLPNQQIKKLFIDRENNLWIGSYGGGLFQYYPSAFSFLLPKYNDYDNSITALFSFYDFILAANEKGNIFKINSINEQLIKIINIKDLLNSKINALYIDQASNLWIGTENNGVFIIDINNDKVIKHFIYPDKSLNNINSIDGFGNNICIASHNGLLIFDIPSYQFEHYTTLNGLPHNYINQVLCDVHGNAWLVTPTNFLAKMNLSTKKIELTKININDILKVNSITFDLKGNLWLATYGNGILYLDTTIVNYTTTNGLFSDYTYSIAIDGNNTVWIGHRQGISSIKGNHIRTFSKNIGMYADCNPNAIITDKNGSIWFGTNKGILHYNIKNSAINKYPPTVVVTSIKINDIENVIKPFIELESGRYKIQFTYAGISLRESDQIRYQYMLEGYDANWSELTSNTTVIYPRLEEGDYVFKVIAYNADQVVSKNTYTVRIKILPPFYKRWWFIVLSIVTIIYLFYLIVRIRERNLRRMEKILKEKLDQRTKEVIRQKELLEKKNKDITDSIQYAKRIQEAILPSLRILHEYYPKSFVLYQPRDIVSGDFYMFYSYNDKFIVICADATGHGVPGAFMSLISSTILKDILHLHIIESPSTLLYKLDQEITTIFNQEDAQTQDGLDIAVVIIDKTTNLLTFSSAMRPLLLFHDKKWTYIKGNRFSIGLSAYIKNKEFTDTIIPIKQGDRFYLFTDGLPDQFSFNEQKLKVSGLIHWIEDVQHLPMTQQLVEIQKRLILWRGEQPQIDDILLIGLEI